MIEFTHVNHESILLHYYLISFLCSVSMLCVHRKFFIDVQKNQCNQCQIQINLRFFMLFNDDASSKIFCCVFFFRVLKRLWGVFFVLLLIENKERY